MTNLPRKTKKMRKRTVNRKTGGSKLLGRIIRLQGCFRIETALTYIIRTFSFIFFECLYHVLLRRLNIAADGSLGKKMLRYLNAGVVS